MSIKNLVDAPFRSRRFWVFIIAALLGASLVGVSFMAITPSGGTDGEGTVYGMGSSSGGAMWDDIDPPQWTMGVASVGYNPFQNGSATKFFNSTYYTGNLTPSEFDATMSYSGIGDMLYINSTHSNSTVGQVPYSMAVVEEYVVGFTPFHRNGTGYYGEGFTSFDIASNDTVYIDYQINVTELSVGTWDESAFSAIMLEFDAIDWTVPEQAFTRAIFLVNNATEIDISKTVYSVDSIGASDFNSSTTRTYFVGNDSGSINLTDAVWYFFDSNSTLANMTLINVVHINSAGYTTGGVPVNATEIHSEFSYAITRYNKHHLVGAGQNTGDIAGDIRFASEVGANVIDLNTTLVDDTNVGFSGSMWMVSPSPYAFGQQTIGLSDKYFQNFSAFFEVDVDVISRVEQSSAPGFVLLGLGAVLMSYTSEDVQSTTIYIISENVSWVNLSSLGGNTSTQLAYVVPTLDSYSLNLSEAYDYFMAQNPGWDYVDLSLLVQIGLYSIWDPAGPTTQFGSQLRVAFNRVHITAGMGGFTELNAPQYQDPEVLYNRAPFTMIDDVTQQAMLENMTMVYRFRETHNFIWNIRDFLAPGDFGEEWNDSQGQFNFINLSSYDKYFENESDYSQRYHLRYADGMDLTINQSGEMPYEFYFNNTWKITGSWWTINWTYINVSVTARVGGSQLAGNGTWFIYNFTSGEYEHPRDLNSTDYQTVWWNITPSNASDLHDSDFVVYVRCRYGFDYTSTDAAIEVDRLGYEFGWNRSAILPFNFTTAIPNGSTYVRTLINDVEVTPDSANGTDFTVNMSGYFDGYGDSATVDFIRESTMNITGYSESLESVTVADGVSQTVHAIWKFTFTTHMLTDNVMGVPMRFIPSNGTSMSLHDIVLENRGIPLSDWPWFGWFGLSNAYAGGVVILVMNVLDNLSDPSGGFEFVNWTLSVYMEVAFDVDFDSYGGGVLWKSDSPYGEGRRRVYEVSIGGGATAYTFDLQFVEDDFDAGAVTSAHSENGHPVTVEEGSAVITVEGLSPGETDEIVLVYWGLPPEWFLAKGIATGIVGIVVDVYEETTVAGQEVGESPVEGAEVVLVYSSTDELVGRRYTGSSGRVVFDDLKNGTYRVTVTAGEVSLSYVVTVESDETVLARFSVGSRPYVPAWTWVVVVAAIIAGAAAGVLYLRYRRYHKKLADAGYDEY